ncbi:MAG: carboxy terminal-processing peptidase [Gammaproteobacteria bacterium]|jgi:carboxyl-terminal processing protease|nr:carboxy terminal-processing peptidase [Gammaproteobacteria bacterium]
MRHIAIFALCAAPWITAAAAVPTDSTRQALLPEARHSEIARAVYALSERFHYEQAPMDNEFSSKAFDQFLDSLDPSKMYFLQSDIERFEPGRYQLEDSLRTGQVDIAFRMFDIYQSRASERLEYVLGLLKTEPDFTLNEEFAYDRSDAHWAKDIAELDELWRKRVKNDALSLALTDKPWTEIQEILGKRYQRVLTRITQVKPDDVFEIYMNAFTHTLDPHSSYMSPRNSEEYRIQMSLSYDGIGASLQLIDDYVTIMNVIPGGPAAIDGTLKQNDRITAVGQEDGDLVDVIGWRLDDVVDLIRGPGGTRVNLHILPAGAAPGSGQFVLELTRDKIKLEAQAAQKKMVEVQRGEKTLRIGVVEVPSFYLDFQALIAGDENYTSTTRDVRRLVEELKADGMDGLILDLRNNGGGHLQEAQSLSGLFIGSGPVVQLRHTNGRIEVLNDADPDVAYTGPMAVLVNRFSASASEIFAAAIQDYKRGVVVGQQTYGKGTVQNLFSLDRYKRSESPGFGQLTLTIGKYYRVTGGSTQNRGVSPDIELPSAIDMASVGESSQKTAMPWDQINGSPFKPGNAVPDQELPILVERHRERAATDPQFQALLGEFATFEEARARKTVSLNLAVRKAERDKLNEKGGIEGEDLAAEGVEDSADGGTIDPSVPGHGQNLPGSLAEEEESPDVILGETEQIVIDMINLQSKSVLKAATQVAETN